MGLYSLDSSLSFQFTTYYLHLSLSSACSSVALPFPNLMSPRFILIQSLLLYHERSSSLLNVLHVTCWSVKLLSELPLNSISYKKKCSLNAEPCFPPLTAAARRHGVLSMTTELARLLHRCLTSVAVQTLSGCEACFVLARECFLFFCFFQFVLPGSTRQVHGKLLAFSTDKTTSEN